MRDFDWKILSTLYRTKNITKTAELLFMTQPTLTRRLQQIESELGSVLILRTNKGVSFTPEGTMVALRSAEMLQILNRIRADLAQNEQKLQGTLRLGAPNSYLHFVLPSLLEEFTSQYPEIQVELHTGLSHELLRNLEAGELDASFVRGEVHTPLKKKLLAKDQIHLISRERLDLNRLPQVPMIDYPKENSVLQATRAWWRERFSEPQLIRLRVHTGDVCLEMVRHGLGYGIFSDPHYADPAEQLYAYPLEFRDGSRFTRDSWLIYDENSLDSPLLSHFVEFVDRMQEKLWPAKS